MRLTSAAVTGALLLAFATPAFALDEIYSPNVEQGEVSLEYNGSRTFDHNDDKNNAQEHELALEYGVNSRWEVEGSVGFEKDADTSHTTVEDVELENRLQFFEQGSQFVDSGLLVAFDKAVHDEDANSLEVKLLLQKDLGRFTNTANIGFEQTVGKNAAGGPDWAFLWSTRYRLNETVQPGFEIQSDLGVGKELSHFSDQEHYAGPAVYGRVLGNLHYEAAYLFGVSDAASQGAARLLLEYEMHF